jgi:hypothetical protein
VGLLELGLDLGEVVLLHPGAAELAVGDRHGGVAALATSAAARRERDGHEARRGERACPPPSPLPGPVQCFLQGPHFLHDPHSYLRLPAVGDVVHEATTGF